MRIKILVFGIARDICGSGVIHLKVPETATAGQVKQLLTEEYPHLGQLKSFLLAVNEEYAELNTLIAPGDEIALIPPVSGG